MMMLDLDQDLDKIYSNFLSLTIDHFFFSSEIKFQCNDFNGFSFVFKETVITFTDKLQTREWKFCFRSRHCQSGR